MAYIILLLSYNYFYSVVMIGMILELTGNNKSLNTILKLKIFYIHSIVYPY